MGSLVHVTCDSETTFKVKRSKVKVTRPLNASGSCSGERRNVLGVGNYCYVAVYSAALGASAPTEGGEGRGISSVGFSRLGPVGSKKFWVGWVLKRWPMPKSVERGKI